MATPGTGAADAMVSLATYNARLPLPATEVAPMPRTLKALVQRAAARGVLVEQAPVPQPGPNEVLIKVEKTAICGTDLQIYLMDEWSQPTIRLGLVIGHEFVGRIAELGPGV